MTAKLLIDQVLPRSDLAVAHARVFPVPPEVCYQMVRRLDFFQAPDPDPDRPARAAAAAGGRPHRPPHPSRARPTQVAAGRRHGLARVQRARREAGDGVGLGPAESALEAPSPVRLRLRPPRSQPSSPAAAAGNRPSGRTQSRTRGQSDRPSPSAAPRSDRLPDRLATPKVAGQTTCLLMWSGRLMLPRPPRT